MAFFASVVCCTYVVSPYFWPISFSKNLYLMFLFILLNQEYIDLFCTRKGPKNKEGLPRKVFVLLDNAFLRRSSWFLLRNPLRKLRWEIKDAFLLIPRTKFAKNRLRMMHWNMKATLHLLIIILFLESVYHNS